MPTRTRPRSSPATVPELTGVTTPPAMGLPRSSPHRWSSRTARALPALAVASLVSNLLVIGTGGAVRLTSSGLGCPTWPSCTAGSYVNTPEYGIHGTIEFGNRLLTFVLSAVVLATLGAALAGRRRWPGAAVAAVGLFVGIPAQAVLGGITVLTHLNPWVVSLHYLLSAGLVALATVLVLRTRAGHRTGSRIWAVPGALRALAVGTGLAVVAVIYVGTIVTGSGPHAGDGGARRTGLDPAAVSQLHADLVMLLLGLTVGLLVAVRVLPDAARPRRSATVVGWLLLVELGQAVVGAVQYVTGLPVGLVDLHLVGAAGLVAVLTWTLSTLRTPRTPRT